MSSLVTSHAGRPSAHSVRSSNPMSLSIVTGLNPRRPPRGHERIDAFTLKHNGIPSNGLNGDGATGHQPQTLHHPHTFFPPYQVRQRLTYRDHALKIAMTRTTVESPASSGNR